MNSIQRQLNVFRQTLKEHADAERAIQEKKYLKSPFKFFGTSLPLADDIAKGFRRSNKDAGRDYVFALAERLWSSDYHDEKRLGLRILQYYPEYIEFAMMPMLAKMLMQSSGWDFIDDISIHLVGTVLGKDKKAYAYLEKWSELDNFWMRRASLVSQILLFRNGNGDKKLFFSFAEKMIQEKEFFIRKAIGWCLREMSKANPDEAFDFLMKIKGRASGLTLREGAKRLSASKKEAVLADRK